MADKYKTIEFVRGCETKVAYEWRKDKLEALGWKVKLESKKIFKKKEEIVDED